MKISYANSKTPRDYKCKKCGAKNCKLYREYQTFHVELRCARCASKDMLKTQREHSGWDGDYSIDTLDANGLRTVVDTFCKPPRTYQTDQIGMWIPAVPDEEGVGYWGYTSIPQAGCEWWRRLPTFPEAK
jgi:DNA-directed RNA polymerase subunit RPC12/RpoP